MGRTVPTFRMLLDSIIMELGDFRRALRRRDRQVFDRIMDMAREHASASTVAAAVDPMDTIVLSILIEPVTKGRGTGSLEAQPVREL